MRFCKACVTVAEGIEQQMTQENQMLLMETPYPELWKYHFTVGMWIRNHCLDEKEYLYQAFRVLGFETKDDMSLFLIEFTQRYLLLKQADML